MKPTEVLLTHLVYFSLLLFIYTTASAGSMNWEISAFKPCTDQTSVIYHFTPLPTGTMLPCSLWCCSEQQCSFTSSSIWSSHKQGQTLRRISVSFWSITTSKDGEGRTQTGRAFLALLNTLMGSPKREASSPCSQWRNTTSHITLHNTGWSIKRGWALSCAWHD